MTILENAIWIVATACIVFLIVAHVKKSTAWQRGRDILLVISCAMDSGVFFFSRHYWMGIAYAIPVFLQGQMLLSGHRRKRSW